MIKLFSLKQQKKDGEAGGQKTTRSAAQLRITKGMEVLDNFFFKIFIFSSYSVFSVQTLTS